jgi:outer membrane receptor protein involved in Fe transport
LYRTTNSTNTILDHSGIAYVHRKLSKGLELNGIVGFNARTDEYVQSGLESSGQVIFGLMEHRNFSTTTSRDYRNNNLNRKDRRTVIGVYFDAGMVYKNFLYLNLALRNDYTSTQERGNNRVLYPGISASFIPTAFFPGFGEGVLDFLKIRMGYGSSAGFANPYNTRPILPIVAAYQSDGKGNVSVQSQNSVLANRDLRPELQTELEFGLESQLFENRIKVDFSWYSRAAKDQIIKRQLDPSTGYPETLINAGEISNKGVETGFAINLLC